MSDTIRTDDPSFVLLCRKAAAFDAIAMRGVRVAWVSPLEGPQAWQAWLPFTPGMGTSPSLLDAIEAALSTDRQTPKQTFGEVAE